MTFPRWRRILAIAWRDLYLEFKNRRSLLMPLISALILIPLALVPPLDFLESTTTFVSGDVPDDIVALPHVEKIAAGGLIFKQEASTLVVTAWNIPLAIRDKLDQDQAFSIHTIQSPPSRYPNRGLMFALLAASTMIGSLAQSIPGERSQRTLHSLLTAAVTPLEIAIGKWLAWGGLGAMLALMALGVATALGRVSLGLWMAAVPWGPLAASAWGLFLVRRARDVVGGSTVALRVLPAILMFAGIFSYFIVDSYPLLSAIMPLGGALMAAGDVYTNPALIILAILSTAICTLVLLMLVAADLDPPPPSPAASGRVAGLIDGGVLTVGSWLATLPAVIWFTAGSEALSRTMTLTSGRIAVICVTFAWLGMANLRRLTPKMPFRPLAPWSFAVGILAFWAAQQIQGRPWIGGLPAHMAFDRFHDMMPALASPLWSILLILAQEAMVRGRIQRLSGPGIALLVWIIACSPLDLPFGITTGLALGLVAYTGGWQAAAAVRVLVLLAPPTPVPVYMPVLAIVGLLPLFYIAWRTHRGEHTAPALP